MDATHYSYAFKNLHHQLNCLPVVSKEPILPLIANINLEVFKLLHLVPDTPTNVTAKKEAVQILQKNSFLTDVVTAIDNLAGQQIFDLIINIQAAVEVLLVGDDCI